MIPQIAVALLLVVANGFFVATEFGIARMRPTQLAAFEAAGRPGARSLRHAVDHLDAYLAACQLGITISSIGLGFVGKPAFEELIDPVAELLGDATGIAAYGLSFFFAFALVTLLHVVFGELAPKSMAISRNTGTALAVAFPMRVFYIAMKPLVDAFNWMGNMVLRPFGIPPASEAAHAPHSGAELRELLRHSVQEGLLNASDLEYAENVFAFGDRRARQIMVPRPEIDYLTTVNTLREAAECATRTGHTRLPLCEPESGLDAALGVVNAKDVLRAVLAGDEPPLRELAHPLERVSESMRIDELLTQLRAERRHVALVVDEHGTTVGLVSLEDVLEEIVGEIEDEFDPRAEELIREQDGTLVVKGSAPLHLVAERLELELEDAHESTIGGHVLELLGRLPDPGETVAVAGERTAEVVAVGDGRILELRFFGGAMRRPLER